LYAAIITEGVVMADFKIDMSIEQILDKMNKNDGNTETIHAGPCFLQYKFHRTLMEEQNQQHKALLNSQNDYNKKQLRWTRALVFGTWALVLVTLLMIKF
jgi:hypothetical protein